MKRTVLAEAVVVVVVEEEELFEKKKKKQEGYFAYWPEQLPDRS
jgi:hypothetical protein